MLAQKIRQLGDFDLREHFGAGTFRDEIEAFGVFLGPSFVAFGDIAGDG